MCVVCRKITDTSEYLNELFDLIYFIFLNYCKNNSLISYGEPNIKIFCLKNKIVINTNRKKVFS